MVRRPDLGYFDEGLDLLSEATYLAARGPLGEAATIEPLVYRSLAFAYLEDEAIWTRDWVCVGTLSDLSGTGDLLPFTVGNHGIHVQRMTDGSLEGRFNKAQHGGCRVVPVQCQGGTKTKCSFTSCGYSRDRHAIAAREEAHDLQTMHQYLGLRPERLFRVAVAVLGPLIFVNLDPNCGSFAPGADTVSAVTAFLDTQAAGPVAARPAKEWREFDANWKLTAQALAASLDAAPRSLGGAVAGERRGADGRRVASLWLFPNVVLLSAGSASAAVIVQQTAVEKSLCRIHLFAGSSSSVPDDAAGLLADIGAAGDRAVAAQRRVYEAARHHARPGPVPQDDPIALWAQDALIGRVLGLPKHALDAPLFHSVQHYSI